MIRLCDAMICHAPSVHSLCMDPVAWRVFEHLFYDLVKPIDDNPSCSAVTLRALHGGNRDGRPCMLRRYPFARARRSRSRLLGWCEDRPSTRSRLAHVRVHASVPAGSGGVRGRYDAQPTANCRSPAIRTAAAGTAASPKFVAEHFQARPHPDAARRSCAWSTGMFARRQLDHPTFADL